MASYVVPKKNAAYVFYLSLVSQTSVKITRVERLHQNGASFAFFFAGPSSIFGAPRNSLVRSRSCRRADLPSRGSYSTSRISARTSARAETLQRAQLR